MRIVVNDIAAGTGGSMTVLQDFYACVCEHDCENQWIFLLNDRCFPETDNVKILTLPKVKKSRLRKLLFDFVTGKRYINALAPDVVLSLQNIITFGVKAPQLVYIHQAIPFQEQKRFSFLKKGERGLALIQHFIGGVIKLSAKKADKVIVQTRWMAEAVCRMCRLPQSKVLVSLPAVKPVQSSCEEFDKTAFFYPTADAIYKNNICVREASRLLSSKGLAHTITMTLPTEQTAEQLHCVGRLPYEQVLAQYRRTTLVFASYIETFGYPLAEARQAGTVILASDTPFSREVLTDYENAYFFRPFRPQTLADLMEQVIRGQIVKKETHAPRTAPENSWLQVMEWVKNEALI